VPPTGGSKYLFRKTQREEVREEGRSEKIKGKKGEKDEKRGDAN